MSDSDSTKSIELSESKYYCKICSLDFTNKDGDHKKSKRSIRLHKKTDKHKENEKKQSKDNETQTSEIEENDVNYDKKDKEKEKIKPQFDYDIKNCLINFDEDHRAETTCRALPPYSLLRMTSYIKQYLSEIDENDENIDILRDFLERRCNHKIYYNRMIDGSFLNFCKPLDDFIFVSSLDLYNKYYPEYKLYEYQGRLIDYSEYCVIQFEQKHKQ